jgi:UDP-glucose 4-epimerase
MSNKVTVFGGSGFLGSYVADELTDSGYDVTVFDVCHSPYIRTNQKMVVGDIRDREAVLGAVKGASYIYNMAGIADIAEAKNKPLDTATVNVVGNVNILEACRLNSIKRVVFASTVYVFSNEGSFYRVSKQAGERYVEAYYEQYGLEYTILRYGSLYGRRASPWNGIYKILRQALENKSIIYEGHADAMREYIHVKDAARLSVDILQPKYANQHIIITGQERLSVKALLRMVAEMIPGEVKTVFKDSRPDGHYVMSPYSFNPKIGQKLIGNQHIDIGQGLLDCLAGIYEELNSTDKVEGDLIVKKTIKED